MQWLHIPLFTLYVLLLCLAVFRLPLFEDKHVGRRTLNLFFLLKVLAGIGFTLVYTYYYTDQSKSDIYRYYNDSLIISQLLFQNPKAWWGVMSGAGLHEADIFQYLLPTQYFSHTASDPTTQNTLIIKWLSLLNFVSLYNIYINSLLFSFLSFTGCFLLYQSFKNLISKAPQLVALPFFLLPSFLFWTSGITKETLIIFLSGLYFYGLAVENKRWKWIIIFIALLLIYSVKIYIGVALTAAGVVMTYDRYKPGIISIYSAAVITVVIVTAIFLFKDQGVCNSVIGKRNEFIELALTEKAGSLIDNSSVLTCRDLAFKFPQLFIGALLEPYLWKTSGAIQMYFGLEAMFILLFVVSAIVRFQKPEKQILNTLTAVVIYCFICLAAIGLTVPVAGAIVHYRAVAIPYVLIAVLPLFNLDIFLYNKYARRIYRLMAD